MLYPDIDYNHLIDLLNGILVRFNKNINTRETYNKKRAEQTEQQVHILSVDGKETGSVVIDEKPKKKKKVKQTTEKVPKKKPNTPHLKESKTQKQESEVSGLLNILKLPPGPKI
jgi:hypothetical protein